MRCILHLGMPKCGSSALQTMLSRNPYLPPVADNPGLRYMALTLDDSGRLMSGKDITKAASNGYNGFYIHCADPVKIGNLDDGILGRLGEEIVAAAAGDNVILSSEGWANHYHKGQNFTLLERLGLKVEVLMYVRPQVGWCNSGWWQWGAWSEFTLSQWVEKQINSVRWSEVVRGWSKVPGVVAVHTRLLPSSIVTDFCSFMGVAPPSSDTTVNASLPGEVLRLFQRHRSLRPSEHDPFVDFVIERNLRLDGEPTPWVLEPELIHTIIEGCRASNEDLCQMLDPVDAELMRSNPAWWSADHWAGRELSPWQITKPDADKSDALAAAAITALSDLDRKYRKLLARI